MRTTVDIPDELYRRAKSEAALRGKRLKDLVDEGLRRVLGLPVRTAAGNRLAFPLVRSGLPGTLHPEQVNRAEDQMQDDEDAAHGRPR